MSRGGDVGSSSSGSSGSDRTAALQRWRDAALIAALLAALAAGCALGGWAWRLDRLVYDLGLALWSRPPPPGIVIVAIDDASIEAIGRWPWSRAIHATLLERLARAQPKAIALDLVLSEPDPDPEQDRLLARALSRAATVVVPVTWPSLGAGPLLPLEPTAALRGAVRLGASESVVDADGVLRHAFLYAGPLGARYPHLAVALLGAGGEAVHARVHAEPGRSPIAAGAGGDRDGRFLIRYAGPPGTVERVSYADVLTGAVAADRLAGRYVLIGMTAVGMGDTLATPVNGSHEAMPGVEVLANTLYTLRSGDTLNALGDGWLAALSAALVAALVLTFGLFGPRVALPTAVGSVPLALGASLLALRTGLWCSPAPYALAALLAYPLWSWRRLERAVAGLDQEIARLADEPLQGGRGGRAAAFGDALDTRLQTLQQAGTVVRQARRFLADSLAAMPTAMLVADEHARVVLANSKAAALFDVAAADELLGLDLVRLLAEFNTVADCDWAGMIAALRPLGPGIAVEGRLGSAAAPEIGVHDFVVHDFVVHVAAVNSQGLLRLIVTIADVEPVKQAQREREEVLAFVSHDLRSPASAIVLLADMNLQGAEQAPPRELLQEVRRLAARTLVMSEDFVRAAQVQTQALARAPVRLATLLEEALADLRAQALAAGVVLQMRLTDADADASVAVDPLLVARAISNLVSNAIKHSPRGGTVEVLAGLNAALLRVQVRDHGPGLAPEQALQLGRGDQGASVRERRGVGLGLLFVQRVARRHGGSLHASAPTLGCGAVFELQLPASGMP